MALPQLGRALEVMKSLAKPTVVSLDSLCSILFVVGACLHNFIGINNEVQFLRGLCATNGSFLAMLASHPVDGATTPRVD